MTETEDSMDVTSVGPSEIASPSISSSSPRSEVVHELEEQGFDFMESINTKRGTLALDEENDKDKPFKNGLDMFAEEIDLLDSYNVSIFTCMLC